MRRALCVLRHHLQQSTTRPPQHLILLSSSTATMTRQPWQQFEAVSTYISEAVLVVLEEYIFKTTDLTLTETRTDIRIMSDLEQTDKKNR